MKTDLLASRHIGINEQDTAIMLRKIGVNSLDELINQTRQYTAERAACID
jgi:glycine dehydrogenase